MREEEEEVDPERSPFIDYSIVCDSGKKTSSCVWRYFGSLQKNQQSIDDKHVYCIKCFENNKTKKYQRSTSTGNLIKHIKKAHAISLEQTAYRIRRSKDSMTVIKEEHILSSYNIEDKYALLQTIDNCYNPSVTTKMEVPFNEAENSEYLINDINEVLISEVEKRPELYDTSICLKNKAQIRRELWFEVFEALNCLIPLEKLPKTWKNIRDRYQKIKKELGRNGNLKPKYRYYEMLRFLDCVDNNLSNVSVINNELIEQKPKMQTLENYVSNYILINENDPNQVDDRNNVDSNVLDYDYIDQEEIDDETFNDLKQEIFTNQSKTKKMRINEPNSKQQDPLTDDDQFACNPIEEHLIEEHHSDYNLKDDGTNNVQDDAHHQDDVEEEEEDRQIIDIDAMNYVEQSNYASSKLQTNELENLLLNECDDGKMELPLMSITPAQPQLQQQPQPQQQTPQQQQLPESNLQSHQNEQQTVAVVEDTASAIQKKRNEFDIFGNYVAEVMKNLTKQHARQLQMKILQLVSDLDENVD